MGTGYCRIGNYEFRLKKSTGTCGYSVIFVAIVERPSEQIEVFYQNTGTPQNLTRIVTRDRGITQTQTNYTLKDETNATVTSGLLTMVICSLVFIYAINTYFLVYYYNSKILMAKGVLDINDAIIWHVPTVVVSVASMSRPHIIYNIDGSIDVYYKTVNTTYAELTKINRTKDYGVTWADVPHDPSTTNIELSSERIFNLPECNKVGIVEF